MKIFILTFFSLSFITHCYGQNKELDSLSKSIALATSDTQRINISIKKLLVLNSINLDTAIQYGNEIIASAEKINYNQGEARARVSMATTYCFKGNYDIAAQYLDKAKKILTQIDDSVAMARMYNAYGTMYAMQNKFEYAFGFYEKAAAIAEKINEKKLLSSILQNTAISFQQQSNYSKALEFYQKALTEAEQIKDEVGAAYIYLNIAITYNSLDDKARAEKSYLKAIDLAKRFQLKNVEAYAYANLATLYGDLKDYKKEYSFAMKAAKLGKETGDEGIWASSLSRAGLALAYQSKFKEAETLIRQSMHLADSSGQPYNIFQAYSNMGDLLAMQMKYKNAIPYFEKAFRLLNDADLYSAEVGASYARLSESYEKTGNYIKALSTYKISAKIADSIRGRENIKKATELTLNYEFDKKQQLAQAAQERKDAIADKARTRQYFIIAILVLLVLAILLITIIQFKNNKQKYKANLLLSRQKLKVENTLADLRSAQAQLIQSEKMASLGELTAGIAHEIQNPLNFVNNFSEMNKELIDELNAELNTGNVQQAIQIANDIKGNSEKINHHGRRADNIVKGMLQHSRTSTGKKEPTDINALCDEYLRLSYHGLRAKDKSLSAGQPRLNSRIKTDLDPSIGKINLVPQDVGRVLLNLFNNAFFAVNEKKKMLDKGTELSYLPEVTVMTQKLDDKIEIRIKDNGNGISEKIKEKIFQPFFTTKPTGQGTGLGLSLSYDIVKVHGGEIRVETAEGEGTEFIIELPFDPGNA